MVPLFPAGPEDAVAFFSPPKEEFFVLPGPHSLGATMAESRPLLSSQG